MCEFHSFQGCNTNKKDLKPLFQCELFTTFVLFMSTSERTCQSEPKLRDNMLQNPWSVSPVPATGRLQLSRMRLRTDQCV